jgi:TATA-binding protein-associated factor Taf7
MEDDEPPEDEKIVPVKKGKDGERKVDKKFIWPHGITPPLKNVRKRRFRKTLKKKVVIVSFEYLLFV